MRDIKFRAYLWSDKHTNDQWIDYYMGIIDFWKNFTNWMAHKEIMQYTGLKDKNGLTYIYECDIIGVDGIIRGNKYENASLLQDSTNLIIEGFGTKNWWSTYKEAVARGCKDTE